MPWTPPAASAEVLPSAQQEVARLAERPEVRSAVAWARAQEAKFANWQLDLARIPAPPFGEAARSDWLQGRFHNLGLEGVHCDEVGNVFGVLRGSAKGAVSLSAHIDTVFPAGTPLNVRQHGIRLYGPGVSDN